MQTSSFTLSGDVKFEFKHQGFTSNDEMIRITFNTAFIPENNILEAGKWELSPEDIRKDKNKKIPKDFKLRLFFKDFCSTCNAYETDIDALCANCIDEMGLETLE